MRVQNRLCCWAHAQLVVRSSLQPRLAAQLVLSRLRRLPFVRVLEPLRWLFLGWRARRSQPKINSWPCAIPAVRQVSSVPRHRARAGHRRVQGTQCSRPQQGRARPASVLPRASTSARLSAASRRELLPLYPELRKPPALLERSRLVGLAELLVWQVRLCATGPALRATYLWTARCLWVWSGQGWRRCETPLPPPPDLPLRLRQATSGWRSSCARF